ncbi:Uncharacterised protein [Lelliottia amnigena]|nr:Uncharacterised protein [Lelliottia amnigena]
MPSVEGILNPQSGCAADRQTVDFQRRLAYANRQALAFFTADANTFIQFEIVTDH